MKVLVIAGAAAVFMLGALAGATPMSSVTISKQTNFADSEDIKPLMGFNCGSNPQPVFSVMKDGNKLTDLDCDAKTDSFAVIQVPFGLFLKCRVCDRPCI